jgi:hypothetical protein
MLFVIEKHVHKSNIGGIVLPNESCPIDCSMRCREGIVYLSLMINDGFQASSQGAVPKFAVNIPNHVS